MGVRRSFEGKKEKMPYSAILAIAMRENWGTSRVPFEVSVNTTASKGSARPSKEMFESPSS